ncbi:MAG TPA: hypothetical protein VD978_34310 [Azospirillum sp.]|nr:hypothetical protein [Azospirillum sp.]
MPQRLSFSASYRATDMNKAGGKMLDTAAAKGAVEINRRGQEFVLMLKSDLTKMLDDAREDRPQTIEDMLRDYDREKIAKLTVSFMNDQPVGKEIL